MGFFRVGPAEDLVLHIRDRYGIQCFVETGTFKGTTAAWAASHFKRVVTIEASQQLYDEAVARCGALRNIEFRMGDSRMELGAIVPTLDGPAIFWLDAHWSGRGTWGKDDECPLLDEIAAIKPSEHQHFILIDDARLFMSPPPKPHRIEDWPTLGEVLRAVDPDGKGRYVVVIEDVIIVAPKYAKDFVATYCQKWNTILWNKPVARHGDLGILKGLALSWQGLRLAAEGGVRRVRRGFGVWSGHPR